MPYQTSRISDQGAAIRRARRNKAGPFEGEVGIRRKSPGIVRKVG
jgi:hypothetical protein